MQSEYNAHNAYLHLGTMDGTIISEIQSTLVPGDPSAFPVKVFILDIEKPFDSAAPYTLLRSIEFYNYANELVRLNATNFAAFASTYHALPYPTYKMQYHPQNLFFGMTKIGGISFLPSPSWISAEGYATNQRIIGIFNTPQNISKVVINNAWSGEFPGFYEQKGAKSIKAYFSPTLPPDLNTTTPAYNTTFETFTKVFDGDLRPHINQNIVDDQVIFERSTIYQTTSFHTLSPNKYFFHVWGQGKTGEFSVEIKDII